MSENTTVYDIGEVVMESAPNAVPAARVAPDPSPTRISTPRAAASPRRNIAAAAFAPRPHGSAFELPGTLALFVPGLGHLARRQWTAGLFFLSASCFLAAFGWALLETHSRLSQTLIVLGHPRELGIWALALTYVCAAVLYLWNVASSFSRDYVNAPHPALAGVASALLPGWGQVLNGDQRRAALFLSSLWLIGFSWILAAPQTPAVLESMGMYLPSGLSLLSSAAVRWTLPAVVWSVAIYDAVASAASRR